jgi:hypothetical protein
MDTVKRLALHRHFYTTELRLADYGQVLLIGDREAVEHLLAVIKEKTKHKLVSDESEQPPDPDRR